MLSIRNMWNMAKEVFEKISSRKAYAKVFTLLQNVEGGIKRGGAKRPSDTEVNKIMTTWQPPKKVNG